MYGLGAWVRVIGTVEVTARDKIRVRVRAKVANLCRRAVAAASMTNVWVRARVTGTHQLPCTREPPRSLAPSHSAT